jgi:hypothetical protein
LNRQPDGESDAKGDEKTDGGTYPDDGSSPYLDHRGVVVRHDENVHPGSGSDRAKRRTW